jgi:hypothetical protein
MLETIVNGWLDEVKEKLATWEKELETDRDFSAIEKALAEVLNRWATAVLEPLLQKQLANGEYLVGLKRLGARLALRFKEYRTITVHLFNGHMIRVSSPYFTKARPKHRGRKRNRYRGSHLGLEVLGLLGRGSRHLVSQVVQLALLCPSFMVAQAVLAERWITLDIKTIRRWCGVVGQLGIELRGSVSLDGTEVLDGYRLVIGIDGGRLRERTKKRGRKKEGQKRTGYHTEWREPKLFTIYLLDAEGNVVKDFAPLHDATMGKDDEMFTLLERYLRVLDLTKLARIIFCGDGARWIWSRVETLITKLGFDAQRIDQVIDYTHAEQNLRQIGELLPPRLARRARLYEEWKALLWQGDIAGLYEAINRTLTGKRRRQAQRKWKNYFDKNEARMQYQRFKENHIPCGSGCVESAIRRVINLRLKSAGSFWTRAMAECFLFLRSQLLSGRWTIFMHNVTRRRITAAGNTQETRSLQNERKAA